MELRIKDLEKAGMSQMQISKLRQIEAGTMETKSKQEPQKAKVTTNAPNEIVQKALKYVGAGKEAEGALHTYGIQHLEHILVLRIEDLMEADMSLTQIAQLRQIAADMLETK